jgi:hypothetical protein
MSLQVDHPLSPVRQHPKRRRLSNTSLFVVLQTIRPGPLFQLFVLRIVWELYPCLPIAKKKRLHPSEVMSRANSKSLRGAPGNLLLDLRPFLVHLRLDPPVRWLGPAHTRRAAHLKCAARCHPHRPIGSRKHQRNHPASSRASRHWMITSLVLRLDSCCRRGQALHARRFRTPSKRRVVKLASHSVTELGTTPKKGLC